MNSLAKKIKNFWLGEDTQEQQANLRDKEDGFDELFYLDNAAEEEKIKKETEKSSQEKVSSFLENSSNQKKEQSAPHLKIIESPSVYSPTSEVLVIEPTSFSQAPEIIRTLWKGSSVVLNLCKLDYRESQRLVDFVCGGVFAMNGSQKRVGEGVFLLAPSNVNIKKEEKERQKKTNLSEILNFDFASELSKSKLK